MDRSQQTKKSPPHITVRAVGDYASVHTVQEDGLDVIIQTILNKERSRLVVVEGVIDPFTLEGFAHKSELAQELLCPGTNTIRSSTLPSRPLDFLLVRFISIGRYVERNGSGGSPDSDIRDRVMRDMALRETSERDGLVNGFAKFRGLKIYGQRYFTVEQQAIFLEFPSCGDGSGRSTWSGLLLNDASDKVPTFPPWQITDSPFGDAVFLPTEIRDFPRAEKGPGFAVCPNPFDPKGMDRTSPMHFAADLLTASALSYSQLVAFLRNLLQHLPVDEGAASSRSARNNNKTKNDSIKESIRLLHQAREDLADAVDYFDEALQFCQAKGHGDLLSSVKVDLNTLRTKARNVSSLCKEKSDAINNEMALQVSNEALREGKRMTLVTYLGVTYAAVSLSSSMFGMNVKGLGGTVPVYYFVLVSLAIGFLTTAFVVIFARYGPYMKRLFAVVSQRRSRRDISGQ